MLLINTNVKKMKSLIIFIFSSLNILAFLPLTNQNPWWCHAAQQKCNLNTDDSCCLGKWATADDACNDYNSNSQYGGQINPWWSHAAQQKCTTNTDLICCVAMWPTGDDACFAYHNNSQCGGGQINPWWCNAAEQKCSTNTDDSCCTNMCGPMLMMHTIII